MPVIGRQPGSKLLTMKSARTVSTIHPSISRDFISEPCGVNPETTVCNGPGLLWVINTGSHSNRACFSDTHFIVDGPHRFQESRLTCGFALIHAQSGKRMPEQRRLSLPFCKPPRPAQYLADVTHQSGVESELN